MKFNILFLSNDDILADLGDMESAMFDKATEAHEPAEVTGNQNFFSDALFQLSSKNMALLSNSMSAV